MITTRRIAGVLPLVAFLFLPPHDARAQADRQDVLLSPSASRVFEFILAKADGRGVHGQTSGAPPAASQGADQSLGEATHVTVHFGAAATPQGSRFGSHRPVTGPASDEAQGRSGTADISVVLVPGALNVVQAWGVDSQHSGEPRDVELREVQLTEHGRVVVQSYELLGAVLRSVSLGPMTARGSQTVQLVHLAVAFRTYRLDRSNSPAGATSGWSKAQP